MQDLSFLYTGKYGVTAPNVNKWMSASVKSEQETETVKTENNGEHCPVKKFTTYQNFLVSHETENGIRLTIYGDMKE